MSYINMCPECKGKNVERKLVVKGWLGTGRLNWWLLKIITFGWVETFSHYISEYRCCGCGLKWR